VEELIVNKLKTYTLVIGYDHHFGNDRKGNIELLEKLKDKYHYNLEEISAHEIDAIKVSSTKVRNAIGRQIPVVKGGVAGAVLGGVLALIAKQVAQRDSLAAELYAKRLSGEPMTAAELQATERVIADTVSRSSMV
jgi:hypothetical protein